MNKSIKMLSEREVNLKKTEIEANVRHNDITQEKNSKLKSTKSTRKRKR